MKLNKLAFDHWREIAYLSRYGGSGVINTIVGFAVIFSAMTFGCSPVVSNVAGYVVGFVLGFIVSKKFVFRSSGGIALESVRYLVAFAISFAFNLVTLQLMLNYFGLNAVASQIVAASIFTVIMYILSRIYVFAGAQRNDCKDTVI